MICLETGQMKVNDIEDQIEQWAVWFLTPVGSFTTLDEAKSECKKIDYPYHLIRPVAVALGGKAFEIVNW